MSLPFPVIKKKNDTKERKRIKQKGSSAARSRNHDPT